MSATAVGQAARILQKFRRLSVRDDHQVSDADLVGVLADLGVPADEAREVSAGFGVADGSGHGSVDMLALMSWCFDVPKVSLWVELSKSAAAEELCGRGFTVGQLLSFYLTYQRSGKICRGTTTNSVVREIIIPETADPPRCYMESSFMRSMGGGHRATKLVSHAWNSEFVTTVLNVVLDAAEKPKGTYFGFGQWPDKSIGPVYKDGVLNAECLLKYLGASVLSKTYWLCIFAVDEHHAVCGDCWSCSSCDAWRAEPARHLRADPCSLCGQPKRNPCSCGCAKYTPDDPRYEIDLFDRVVARMDGLVVSLDPELQSVKRIWVVAEIGKAMGINTVFFRQCLPLGSRPTRALRRGERLVPSIEDCDATSVEDRRRILGEVRGMDGGISAYDDFINAMLEVNFGRFGRLQLLRGGSARAAASLLELQVDVSWDRRALTRLEGFSFVFTRLRRLLLDCTCCEALASIGEFAGSFVECPCLGYVWLNLWKCGSLTDVDELGSSFGQYRALEEATFHFAHCSGLACVDGFGRGLSRSRTLRQLGLDFRSCTSLTTGDAFWEYLGQSRSLEKVNLTLSPDYKPSLAVRATLPFVLITEKS